MIRSTLSALLVAGVAGAAAAQVELDEGDPLGGGLDPRGIGGTTAGDDIGGPVLDRDQRMDGTALDDPRDPLARDPDPLARRAGSAETLAGDPEGLLEDDADLLSGDIGSNEGLEEPGPLSDSDALEMGVGGECGVSGVLCD